MAKSRIRILCGLVVLALLLLLLMRSNFRHSTTVILGTRHWDVESNSQGAYTGLSDFWWEQVNETTRYLVPQNGATASVVGGIHFDDIDAFSAQHQALFPGMIPGADKGGALKPGTVVVFKTAEGHYGKLQVIRYRPLDDFAVPAATQLSKVWPKFASGKQGAAWQPLAGPPPGVVFVRNPTNTGLAGNPSIILVRNPPNITAPAGNPNQNGNRFLEMFYRIKRYFVRERRRLANYHLEVKWVLFDRESNTVPAPNAAPDK